MLPWLHSNEIIVEARVLVVVDNNPLSVSIRRSQEPVESVGVLESVVEHENSRLGDNTLVAVGIAVVLAGDIGVEGRVKRLVEGFDRSNDVVVFGSGVLLLDLLEDSKGAIDSVTLLPARFGDLVARIVETILRARCTVQVDDHFKPNLACPVDTLV